MKISFVIPAHNEEINIQTCLRSIVSDTKSLDIDTEMIVVNNASSDKTSERAREVPGVIVVDEPRKGLSQARHSGYQTATGDLVANIDADNILPPGWTAKVLAAFKKDPRLVALSGPLVYHDLPLIMRMQTKLFYMGGYVTHLVNHYLLKRGAMLQGGNFVIRKSALDAVGGFDTSISFYGEDTAIAKRLIPHGRVAFHFSLPMLSSGRRIAHEGIVKIGARYALNYFWMTVFGRPFTRDHKDIR